MFTLVVTVARLETWRPSPESPAYASPLPHKSSSASVLEAIQEESSALPSTAEYSSQTPARFTAMAERQKTGTPQAAPTKFHDSCYDLAELTQLTTDPFLALSPFL